jgi:hypothetical protein
MHEHMTCLTGEGGACDGLGVETCPNSMYCLQRLVDVVLRKVTYMYIKIVASGHTVFLPIFFVVVWQLHFMREFIL